jgi:hypothetical protein
MLPDGPWLYRVTAPQLYARWQALRRHLVHEAVKLPPPHIIEGTHILTAPELPTAHRRIQVMHRGSGARPNNGMEPTPYSVRSYVAAASGRGSCLALGSASCH